MSNTGNTLDDTQGRIVIGSYDPDRIENPDRTKQMPTQLPHKGVGRDGK